VGIHQGDKMRKLLVLLVLFFAVPLFAACGASESYYKDQYVRAQLENYVFHTDFNYVWKEARTMLFQYGYQIHGGADDHIMETEWRQIDSGSYRRYMVSGYEYSDGTNTVHFDYYEETQMSPDVLPHSKAARDYSLEFELIRRVEAQNYAAINNAASQYAKQRVADKK
jgi:hypothetical protein